MKRFYAKCSIWALITVAACFFAVSAAFAEAISEHDTHYRAETVAIQRLMSAGCTQPEIKRSQRYRLETQGDGYLITQALAVVCLKWAATTQPPAPVWLVTWTAPTTREDGSQLPPDQIAGYQVVSAGEVLAMVPGTQYLLSGQLPNVITLRTVDTFGLISRDSDPVVKR